MTRRITLDAPAKLNLALQVAPPAPDAPPAVRGRHPVARWLVALDFADTLPLETHPPEAPPEAPPDAVPKSAADARPDRHRQHDSDAGPP
ncbi:MAG: hypothetical protein AAGG38_15250, partial [Planctomycetota bacterium]